MAKRDDASLASNAIPFGFGMAFWLRRISGRPKRYYIGGSRYYTDILSSVSCVYIYYCGNLIEIEIHLLGLPRRYYVGGFRVNSQALRFGV